MPAPNSLAEHVQRHYSAGGLTDRILAALADAGKDVDRLIPEDLAPIDEFHIRGREATMELGRAVGLDEGKHVLDVGSGVGGPSRCIAQTFGCRVTGVDLTDDYCRAATMLAQRVGLADLVTYRQGDALDLPFANDSFDVVWTQHAAMNIKEKVTLYREMGRVLKPGGSLAIYDILAGPSGDVIFPVPWARSAETSFLAEPGEMRELIESAGLTISSWIDTTAAAREWFTGLAKKIQQSGLPKLGFHVLLGSDFQAMAQNQRRNLEENRIVLVQITATK